MSKRFRFISALLLVSAIAVLASIVIISRVPVSITAAVRATPTPSRMWQPGDPIPVAIPSLEPTPAKSRDLAPEVPMKDKATLILRDATGVEESIYLKPDDVEAFVKTLDKSITVKAFVPPPSVIGHEPPPYDPSMGPLDNKPLPTDANHDGRPTPILPPTPTP